MYQHLYQHFLRARPNLLHCAPHSHYYWPDVTREAQLAYWDDSARFADEKWSFLFSEKVPELQKNIAEELNLSHSEQIVFAPNTHELVYRLLSVFSAAKPLTILTTDGEFHSFNRQSRRILERGNVTLECIPCEPIDTFSERWCEAVNRQAWDMIFISQVFYNSGIIAPEPSVWLPLVNAEETLVVVDGYHGFCALETNWQPYEDRIFYLSGAYKYAQGGEGMCFAVVPKNCRLRPEYTGWFADFAGLAKAQEGAINYSDDGMRFAGATMDFSALYRLNAVFDLWRAEGLDTATRHAYVQSLQQAFLAHIDGLGHRELNRQNLLLAANDVDSLGANHTSSGNAITGAIQHGHFFTFLLDSAATVEALAARLREQGVATDYRNKRLRFGFALYQNPNDFQRIRG
ncbi:selenocysteine lyase [Aliidiomarina iranensis]|uniref:Selenocysteine lyase n=1 Tax=Aliidiomarina iranensis TaxID=1434071 RepID=A0A432W2I7_9GAMM|nr:aminotransferase class V-fold PLP-dependent enzyme [Aliidiomarina iranensis]RUO23424.1 selenocysteine lyase [Aliidiomarina iranensis]